MIYVICALVSVASFAYAIFNSLKGARILESRLREIEDRLHAQDDLLARIPSGSVYAELTNLTKAIAHLGPEILEIRKAVKIHRIEVGSWPLACPHCGIPVPDWFMDLIDGERVGLAGIFAPPHTTEHAIVADTPWCKACTNEWPYPKDGQSETDYELDVLEPFLAALRGES